MSDKEPRYFYGFDYLRAIFSVCVVLVHLGYVAPSNVFDPEKLEKHSFALSDAINFYILCSAVPVFLLMTCVLISRSKSKLIWTKTFRAVRLLVFWSVLLHLYHSGVFAWSNSLPRHAWEVLVYIASGFNTIYYFFFLLGLAIPITYAARRLSDGAIYILCVVTSAFVGLLPVLALQLSHPELTCFFSPLNFIPYPFIAIAIERQVGRVAYWHIAVCMLAGLGFATLDWTIYKSEMFFRVNSFAIPAYARPSVILFSAGIVVVATIRSSPVNPVVKFMSAHSLALYCLHPFTLWAAYGLVARANLPTLLHMPTMLAFVLTLCYACSVLALPLFLKRDLYC